MVVEVEESGGESLDTFVSWCRTKTELTVTVDVKVMSENSESDPLAYSQRGSQDSYGVLSNKAKQFPSRIYQTGTKTSCESPPGEPR